MTDDRESAEHRSESRSIWDETRRRQAHLGREMTPAERLRWLEETMEELQRLRGFARRSHPTQLSDDVDAETP